nr:class I SAM-dependent methyltransferase [Saccharothrix syringae]
MFQAPHRQRQAAESFGADPARYDRARPAYPEAMVEAVVAAAPGPDVLDVGIGTGIAARQFRAAGCRVLGVDADPRMAEFARRDGFEVEVSTFESWDPAGRAFDVVIAGQTWHWVDPAAGAARAAGVLRPGGRLAAFWNVFQPPPDVSANMAAIHREFMPRPMAEMSSKSALEVYSLMFAKAVDGIRGSAAFDEPEEWRFEWERHYTRDEWLDMLPTQGGYTHLSPERFAELTAAMGDAVGDGFTAQYTAVVVTATIR